MHSLSFPDSLLREGNGALAGTTSHLPRSAWSTHYAPLRPFRDIVTLCCGLLASARHIVRRPLASVRHLASRDVGRLCCSADFALCHGQRGRFGGRRCGGTSALAFAMMSDASVGRASLSGCRAGVGSVHMTQRGPCFGARARWNAGTTSLRGERLRGFHAPPSDGREPRSCVRARQATGRARWVASP